MVTAWPARLAMFANEFHSTGAFGARGLRAVRDLRF
jgi:hypothetical protein